jgi:hypothetical protein
VNCQALLDRLDAVRQRGTGRWSAKCPAHADQSPSLSIREVDDGRILIYCFAGCDVHAITAALGIELSDLFPERLGHSLRSMKRQRLITATQALEIINADALFIAVTACDLARQALVQESIKDKLLLAASRINLALRESL